MRDQDDFRQCEAMKSFRALVQIRVSLYAQGAEGIRRFRGAAEKFETASGRESETILDKEIEHAKNLKKLDVDDFYEALYHSAIDVVQSDLPLDERMRHLIAGILKQHWYAFYDPKFDRKRKKRVWAKAAAQEIREARALGIKNYDQHLADSLGMPVDTLRKRITRARK
jgi:hypothetical protein